MRSRPTRTERTSTVVRADGARPRAAAAAIAATASAAAAIAAVAGLVLVALVLAGCGGGAGGEGGLDATFDTSDVTLAPAGPPRSGGSLTMAVEAETDGFDPTASRWAISGYTVANAVFDPLAAFDADGVPQPYLAESFTPNADHTAWTIELRDGVRFHDGHALDGAALELHLDEARASTLTGASLANVEAVEVDPADPMAVVVTMAEPWASFPVTLAAQVGFVAAPAQLTAEGDAGSRRPIGTGPFVQREWVPDRSWVGTRNADYWRTDAHGQRLPYLDEVVVAPLTDLDSRLSALRAGDVQLAHATNWTVIRQMKAAADAGEVQFATDRGESDENLVMFNTQAPEVADVRVRRAAALCLDRTQLALVADTPTDRRAHGPFATDSPWHNPDAVLPEGDLAAGQALVAEVEAESGPVRFELATVPTPETRAAVQTLEAQWEACGMEVATVETEQSSFIAGTVRGDHHAALWRQFGSTDPDGEHVWWIGDNAAPPGQLALNMARLQDAEVDEALRAARATRDPDRRREAYATVQARHAELVPYLWLSHALWAIGAANDVRGIGNQTLPDGQAALPFQSGSFRLTETWLER